MDVALDNADPHDALDEFMLLNRNIKYDAQLIVKLKEELERVQKRQGWEPPLLQSQLTAQQYADLVESLQIHEQQLRDLLEIHQSHRAEMLSQIGLIAV